MFREKETRWVIALLSVVTIFRLWYCTYNDLVGDEAYYWLWSKHLDASYFSKGPAIAWTIALGTRLFGDTVFGVRFISVMLSLGTGWQLYLLTRRLYTPRTGFWVVLAAAFIPLFAAGSVLMTIDPLSVFFWLWAINLFWDAIDSLSLARWILVGFAVGSGFLAKYTNAMELLSFLLFFSLSASHRRLIFSRQLLALVATFIFCATPVLWWNQQHQWITVDHLRQNGHLDEHLRFSFTEFLKFLEGQALVISPFILISILIAAAAQCRPGLSSKELLLQTLFWPVLLMYALLSFHDAANPNWTALSYISGLVLAANYWQSLSARVPAARNWCIASLIVGFVLTSFAHETFFLHLRKDPLMRVRGWREWGRQAEAFREKFRPDYLMANDNDISSELSFYLPGQPMTYIPDTGHIVNQFSFWPSYKHGAGKSVLYITDDPIETLPGLLPSQFLKIESVGSFDRTFRGRHISTYRVWLLTN